ncbi:hypothetical protein MHM93_14335 [Pseudoalteromonas sp. MM17-2]|uniref:hypothetical protein n=1 Tax=Pseudoalteromonas sp. MM17-2 TaxID=2917753 RepID=UPI001EF72B75|nr:hypothetical protein [Pseudoalteromonas sp. MM17-2]MCG7545355.1 hypothetical protein [Pseudoalteromonas sp. MM17-2]
MDELLSDIALLFSTTETSLGWDHSIASYLSDHGFTLSLGLFLVYTIFCSTLEVKHSNNSGERSISGYLSSLSSDSCSTVISATILFLSYLFSTLNYRIFTFLQGNIDSEKTWGSDVYLSYVLTDSLTLFVIIGLHAAFRVKFSFISRRIAHMMMYCSAANIVFYLALYLYGELEIISYSFYLLIAGVYVIVINASTWGTLAIIVKPQLAQRLWSKVKEVFTTKLLPAVTKQSARVG